MFYGKPMHAEPNAVTRWVSDHRAGAAWVGVLLATVVLGSVTRALDVGIVGGIAYIGVAGAYVVLAKKGRRPVAAIQASILIVAVALSTLAPPLVNSAGPVFVVGLCGLAMVLDRPRGPWPRALWFVVAFSLLFAVSTAVSQPLIMAGKAAGIGVMWTAVAVVASHVDRSQMRQRIFPTLLALGGVSVVISFFEAVVQWPFVIERISAGINGTYVQNWTTMLGFPTLRAQATFGYPIILGAFLAICLVLVLILPGMRIWTRGVLSVLYIAGIVMAGARSAVLALAVALVVLVIVRLVDAWRSEGRRQALRSPAVLLPAGAMLLGVVAAGSFVVRSMLVGDFSLFHRSAMLSAVAEAFHHRVLVANLFGSGYGSVERGFQNGLFGTDFDVAVIDNAFASTFITTGIIGVVLLVAVLVVAAWRADDITKVLLATIVAEFFIFDLLAWHAISVVLFMLVGHAFRGRREQPSA